MKKSGFLFLGLLLLPSLVFANVVINEIAWMGSNNGGTATENANDEWIELYNNGSSEVNLEGWILVAADGSPNIILSNVANKIIPVGGFFLLERTDDNSVPGIIADLIYTGSLSNDGEKLILKDATGNPVDTVDGSDNWKISGGDIIGNNTTKETAQRIGSSWITATATPRAVNFAPPEPPFSQQQTQSSSQPSGGNSSTYIPPEKMPKIKAYAGENKTVTVGASVEFRGQAFGLDDEPLDNARYLWTFGDGASKEGKNITHVYQYPGEYIVSLNVSSGEYSASDYLLIKAVPNQVFISEIKTGADSFIELENKSKEEIDISGCQLKYNNQTFIFPQSTRIRPNAFLVIPSSVSGIVLAQGKGIVELLYAGGFKADSLSYDGFPSESQSFNRSSASSLIGSETPGAKNSIVVAQSAEVATPQNRNGGGATFAKTPSVETVGAKEDNPQTANVITVGDSTDAKSNTKIYLFAVLGLIVFGGGAVLFIHRHNVPS